MLGDRGHEPFPGSTPRPERKRGDWLRSAHGVTMGWEGAEGPVAGRAPQDQFQLRTAAVIQTTTGAHGHSPLRLPAPWQGETGSQVQDSAGVWGGPERSRVLQGQGGLCLDAEHPSVSPGAGGDAVIVSLDQGAQAQRG